jgi:hypothetical protein
MITDETRPEDFVNDRKGKYSHIKGWGIDANPENDPTYPMKKRTNAEHDGYSWKRPAQQSESVEILKSVERPNLSAVFGTSAPLRGISGLIRRLAYKYSESSYGRWLPLVMADRIDMVEGIVEDLSGGHLPNFPEETGMKAEWKHNKKGVLIKVAVGAAVVTLLATLYMREKRRAENA